MVDRTPIITKDCKCCEEVATVGYIYLTINKVNNKKYIGKHSTLSGEKDKSYLGSGFLLSKAIKKYGFENFDNWVLQWAYSYEELNELEINWIKELNAVDSKQYYNVTPGGNGFTSEYIKKRWESGLYKDISGDNNPSKRDDVRIKLSNKTREYSANNPDFVSYHASQLKKCWKEHREKFPQCNRGKDSPFYNRGKSVICIETNQVFPNSYRAADWVAKNFSEKYSKANGDKILLNCKGESKSAYKFHWRFFEDKI